MRGKVRISLIYAFIACFVALSVSLLVFNRPTSLYYWHEYREGNRVVSVLDRYYRDHKSYPDSLNSIGVDSSEIFYEKKSKDAFVVWFGTTLGEPVTYDSTIRVWK